MSQADGVYMRPELNKLGNVVDVTFDDVGWGLSSCGGDDDCGDD